MAIVKSFAVSSRKNQPGDMFYINHNTDNFTIIDCCLNEEREAKILEELKNIRKTKGIFRFISTHPDDDHICGITNLSNEIEIENFYCVKNNSNNPEGGKDFETYCNLRDGKSSFYLKKGCRRRWLNDGNEERDSSGITILWADENNREFNKVIDNLDNSWGEQNNISPIIRYAIQDSASFLWFGDLETDFMNKIKNNISFSRATIVFAPHHGRESGSLPIEWLEQINPQLIIVGEAPSENLNYYNGYNTITQNSAGDITFEEEGNVLHIYTSDIKYNLKFNCFYNENRIGCALNGCYYKGSIKIK